MQPTTFLKSRTAITSKYDWSPAIWGDCPIAELTNSPLAYGIFFEDQFGDFPLAGTQTTQIGAGKYKVFASSGSSIKPVTAQNSVNIMGNAGMSANLAADNDAASIAQAYARHRMSGLVATDGVLWFEGIIACSSILTATSGWFLGLAETDLWTLSATVPMNAASGTISAAASAIGFYKSETASPNGTVDIVRSDRATSWTNILAAAGTMVANTYIHVGMKYDPRESSKCVKFFIDNVEQSTYLTNAALVAFTNLDAGTMGLIFCNIAAASVSSQVNSLRAWRVAQMWPNTQP